MGTTGSNFNLARVPLIDKNGMATRDFLLWLQQLQAKTDQSLTLAGEVVGNVSGDFSGEITTQAQVQGAPSTLASQIANLDANGIVMPNGLDLTRAYTGKSTANIPAGGTNYYAGEAGADITANHTAKDTSNVNGVDSASISPISGLMPAQAGADVTSQHESATTSSLANQTADGLQRGTFYGILTLARQNAGLDGSGNLLFKSIETGTITASVSIGAVVALSSVISITTVGKPVKIGGIINCEGGSTGASAVGLQLYRDGSPLAGVAEMGSVWFPQSATDSKPIDYLDNAPSAGPHTYQLFGFNNGGPNATTQGGNFSAWEYA